MKSKPSRKWQTGGGEAPPAAPIPRTPPTPIPRTPPPNELPPPSLSSRLRSVPPPRPTRPCRHKGPASAISSRFPGPQKSDTGKITRNYSWLIPTVG